MKPINRAVHFDFHTMPDINNFGEDFSAEKFALMLKAAHVDYVDMFARCNIGFSYYPTRVGIPYPTMRGNMLGDVVRECHKQGISVTGYINAGLNHELSIRHPEWLQMNENGQIYNFAEGGNFFRTVCYNTGYFDHLLEEVREVLALGVDGIFLDCFLLRPCYCSACTRDMLARGIDIGDKKAVISFAHSVRRKVMEAVRAIVPRDKRLFFKGNSEWYGRDINSHFEVVCLPAVWGYDYFAAHAAFARPLYKELVYMNGRFQMSWGDFGGYKGKAAVENDFYDALTQGARPMLGDHLHPAELPEAAVYADLGDIYARLMRYEKYTEGARYIPELAVLANSLELDDSTYGATRILSELKYCYDVVHVEGDLSPYKLLVMPDNITVDKPLAEKLRAFLDGGGKIISSGTSGLNSEETGFALPEWSFQYLGKAPDAGAHRDYIQDGGFLRYFKLKAPPKELADMRYAEYEPALIIKEPENGISLADEYTAVFDKCGYNGRHYVYYTPPAKEKTGTSAIAINAEGNVAHVAFELFRAYMTSFAKVFRLAMGELLARFIPDRLIVADELPVTSRVTLTGANDYRLLHVKVTYPEMRGKLGIVEEHNVIAAGKKLSVKGTCQKVLLLPEETPVPFSVANGYTEITLPEIEGYAMLLLK